MISSIVNEDDVLIGDLGVTSTTWAHRRNRNGHAARCASLRREFQPRLMSGGQHKDGIASRESKRLALDLTSVMVRTATVEKRCF